MSDDNALHYCTPHLVNAVTVFRTPWASEEKLLAILGQIPPGFVHWYVWWMQQQTDAPLAYHVGAALALMAAGAPPRAFAPRFPGGGLIYPNFWSLLIGDAGRGRKTTAVNGARIILTEAAPANIGAEPGSTEAYLDSLVTNRQQLFFYNDFGTFFSQTAKRSGGNHLDGLKPRMLETYDGLSIPLKTMKHGQRVLKDPRPSMLTGINIPLLVRHAEEEDWQGGLLSRWGIWWADPERESWDQLPEKAVEGIYYGDGASPEASALDRVQGWLVDFIRRSSSHIGYGLCRGATPEAHAVWHAWSKGLYSEQRAALARSRTVGSVSRGPLIAAKMSLLLCLASASEELGWNGQPWYIPTYIMQAACELARVHVNGALRLAQEAHPSRDARDKAGVLEAIRHDWTHLGEIKEATGLLRKRVIELIQTLFTEGKIERAVRGADGVFKRIQPTDGTGAVYPTSTGGDISNKSPW